mgnify:FL=1
MIHGTINKEKATRLFEENAILFGRSDGVPENVAIALFGASAVNFARRQSDGPSRRTINGYGIGDYTAWYLTEYGFNFAVTYCNVKHIQKEDSKNE